MYIEENFIETWLRLAQRHETGAVQFLKIKTKIASCFLFLSLFSKKGQVTELLLTLFVDKVPRPRIRPLTQAMQLACSVVADNKNISRDYMRDIFVIVPPEGLGHETPRYARSSFSTRIRSLTYDTQVSYSVVTVYVKYPPDYKWVFYIYVPPEGIEPSTVCLKGSCSTD